MIVFPSLLRKTNMRILYGVWFTIGTAREGIKLFFRLQVGEYYKEKWFILKKNPNYRPPIVVKTPQLSYVEMLTVVPMPKQIQPEDMMGNISQSTLLEPEDM